MTSADLPRAPIVSGIPNLDHPRTTDVTVNCPFCNDTHDHGIADDAPLDQNVRAARCNGQLYLVVDDDERVE